MLEGIESVRAGNPPRLVQDETNATYESWCRKADVEVDWAQPAQVIYNLIRGANPQPGAWTTHAGSEVGLFDCAVSTNTGTPGQIRVSLMQV